MNTGARQSWQPPKRFADYEIIDKIDDGGMGAIYKAKKIDSQQIVAIKIMLHDSQYRRFEREAEASERLNHPNFVRFHKKGEICGKIYIVMDYIDGKPLKNFLETCTSSFHDRLFLFHKILKSIVFAHENGIIHRDLKPANIIITPQREPILLDFGLSKCVDFEDAQKDETYLTLEGQILGTPGYMSPEQARGEANNQDERTDIFSLGIILYEMLSDHNPFEGENIIEICYKIGNQPPYPVENYVPSIPPELSYIISQALENNIKKRYQTATAFLSDLERFFESQKQEKPSSVGKKNDDVICLVCGTGNPKDALYCHDCNNVLKKEFHRDTTKILKSTLDKLSTSTMRREMIPPLPQQGQNLQRLISQQVVAKKYTQLEEPKVKKIEDLSASTTISRPRIGTIEILFGAFGFSFSLIPVFYKYKFPLGIHILDFLLGGLASYLVCKLQKRNISVIFFPLAFLFSIYGKHYFEVVQQPFNINYLPETIVGTILTLFFARCMLLIFRDIV